MALMAASLYASPISITILPASEIDIIRKFLFSVYCLLDKWYPPANDPAQFRVVEGNMLVDDRDTFSTHFVARLPNGEIVGCVRASFDLDDKFQVQCYDHVNDYSKYDAELSRYAVHPKYRGGDLGLRLLHALASWCTENHLLCFSAPGERALSEYYRRIGWNPLDGFQRFRYFQDGNREATVHGCEDLGEQGRVVKRIEVILNKMQAKPKL